MLQGYAGRHGERAAVESERQIEHDNKLGRFDFERKLAALLVHSRGTGRYHRHQLHTQPGRASTAFGIPIHDPAAFPFMWVNGIGSEIGIAVRWFAPARRHWT